MARQVKDVSDGELAVAQVLWDRGPSSIRQIADLLFPGGGPPPRTVKNSLMPRGQGLCPARLRPSRASFLRGGHVR